MRVFSACLRWRRARCRASAAAPRLRQAASCATASRPSARPKDTPSQCLSVSAESASRTTGVDDACAVRALLSCTLCVCSHPWANRCVNGCVGEQLFARDHDMDARGLFVSMWPLAHCHLLMGHLALLPGFPALSQYSMTILSSSSRTLSRCTWLTRRLSRLRTREAAGESWGNATLTIRLRRPPTRARAHAFPSVCSQRLP
eukprot:6183468-Pleurochrysis_carterae.AAC.3